MTAFQRYQSAFAAHLRDPIAQPRPRGAAARGMRVYAEIVFHNMESTLAACFPICKRIVKQRRWKKLVRSFLAGHACGTPWFRQIPEEFLRWLATAPASAADLPPFLPDLAHYEWVELAVALAEDQSVAVDAAGDLLAGIPQLAPGAMLLQYPYAVHRLSPRYQPTQPDSDLTRLLVYRDAADEVRFIELNAVTARLLQLLQSGNCSGAGALSQIAVELQPLPQDSVMAFGGDILRKLHQQGAILGTALSGFRRDADSWRPES